MFDQRHMREFSKFCPHESCFLFFSSSCSPVFHSLISACLFKRVFFSYSLSVCLSSSSCQSCCHSVFTCVSPVAAFPVLLCSCLSLDFVTLLYFPLLAFLLPVESHFIVCTFRFRILGCWTWLRHTFCWITCLPVVLVGKTDLFKLSVRKYGKATVTREKMLFYHLKFAQYICGLSSDLLTESLNQTSGSVGWLDGW